MPKGKAPRVVLPKDWLLRLSDWVRTRQKPNQHLTIYDFTKVSRRTFATAKKDGFTEKVFARLAQDLKFKNTTDLQRYLSGEIETSRPVTPLPKTLSLRRQKSHPQGADYHVHNIQEERPWTFRCRVMTESSYFRVGFKLLTDDGRVFGDSVIPSIEDGFFVHIGRNNWDRPNLKLTAKDIFWTAYVRGVAVEEDDRFIFASGTKVQTSLELAVDKSYRASLQVDGKRIFGTHVSPDTCRRVAVYAWGDREEFQVDLTDLAISSA